MVDSDILNNLKALLQLKKFEHMVLGILYNLSRDFDLRLKILESNLLSILIESFLSEDDIKVPEELGALVINLTYVPKTAMSNLEVLELEKFVLSVLRTNDMLLFKAVKNVSFLKAAEDILSPFIPGLVACLLHREPCIQVEVMETLNNLACFDELRDTLLINNSLLNYITAHLQVSNMEDDVNLQIIMLIARVCSLSSAPTISQAGLVDNLCDVFLDRHGDVDIALQSLHAIFSFLAYDSTRNALFHQFPKVVHYIVELSQDCEKSIMAWPTL
ncbi:hypothetical protein L7F22_033155 [Adiantum nelumboides]|nr:hypothetical protein [Adiantum nelumboides]